MIAERRGGSSERDVVIVAGRRSGLRRRAPDGFERDGPVPALVLQKLLNAQSRHTPIIFVTAFPDERTRNDVLNAGAIGFLSKPYSNEKLAKFLDMALAN